MKNNPSSKKTVTCPTCKKASEYSVENRFRPFCSERCHTLDLGAWADESFKIPVEDVELGADFNDENEKLKSKNELQ